MKVLVILFVSQVALSIASSLRQPANIQGTLTIETRQKRGVNARIEGAYRTNDGEGISFKTSQQSLVIQTLDNQILLYTKTIPVTLQSYSDDHNATMIQIMDEAYMESNEKLYRLSNIDVLSEIVYSIWRSALARATPRERTGWIGRWPRSCDAG